MKRKNEPGNVSNVFSRIVPEFSKEYDAKRAKKNHKQFGFVSAFVYDKRVNKFIFESRGNNN